MRGLFWPLIRRVQNNFAALRVRSGRTVPTPSAICPLAPQWNAPPGAAAARRGCVILGWSQGNHRERFRDVGGARWRLLRWRGSMAVRVGAVVYPAGYP